MNNWNVIVNGEKHNGLSWLCWCVLLLLSILAGCGGFLLCSNPDTLLLGVLTMAAAVLLGFLGTVADIELELEIGWRSH